MACGSELAGELLRFGEVKKRRKGQPHAPSLIGNRCATHRTAHFTGQNSLRSVELTIVEFKPADSPGELDMGFVKYCRQLHGSPVQFLTYAAVADFGVHGIVRNGIGHSTAMAAREIFWCKSPLGIWCVKLAKCFVHGALPLPSIIQIHISSSNQSIRLSRYIPPIRMSTMLKIGQGCRFTPPCARWDRQSERIGPRVFRQRSLWWKQRTPRVQTRYTGGRRQ